MRASDWIKCSERMPEFVTHEQGGYISSDRVLVWTEQHSFQRGRFMAKGDGTQWWYLGGYTAPLDEITHWMPIVGPEEPPTALAKWEDDLELDSDWEMD